MHWSVEVDLQLLCSGTTGRLAITPFLQHPYRSGRCPHQHHWDRQRQLQHRRLPIHRRQPLLERLLSDFQDYTRHRFLPHRLTSSGVTTGWMPWAFQ
jgi:hypothetical protein